MTGASKMRIYGKWSVCGISFVLVMICAVAFMATLDLATAQTPRAELDTTDAAVILEALANAANKGQGTRTNYSADVEAGDQYVVCFVKVSDFFSNAERDKLAPAIAALSPKISEVSLVMECAVPSDDLATVNREWKYYLSGHIRADRLPEPELAPVE